jgi:MYXO-CTERM domain-containing protein
VQILDVRGLRDHTDNAFRRALLELAARLGADASALAAVMSFETGGTFDPAKRNPVSRATGLIQFLPSTASRLGTSVEALARMTQIEQLAYVEKYLRPFTGRIGAAGDLYLAVFSPGFIGKPANTVVAAAPALAYVQNRGLDRDQDGRITVGEVVAPVLGLLFAARQRPPLEVLPPGAAPPETPDAHGSGGGLGALGLALLAGWRWLCRR